MRFRLSLLGGLAFAIALGAVAQARDFEMGGDNEYPNSIMAPEPGTVTHHRAAAPKRSQVPHGRVQELAKQPVLKHRFATRGSAGSVLPAPLPRTTLIPPEGSGALVTHPVPEQSGPTIVPGAQGLGALPNLPHGPETFQDRASRCSFQQGLNNVPGGASSQYMGACVQ
jgi:hypothetical protein